MLRQYHPECGRTTDRAVQIGETVRNCDGPSWPYQQAPDILNVRSGSKADHWAVPWNISFQSVPGTVAPVVDASYSGTYYEKAAYVGCAEMAEVKFSGTNPWPL